MKTDYSYDGKRLIICEPKCSLTIEENFVSPLLPSWSVLEGSKDIALERAPSGKIVGAGFYEGKLRVGQWRRYYESGEIEAECYYLQGELYGPSYFYADNGQCVSKSWFHLGKICGRAERYYVSGQLSSIEYYHYGRREGEQTSYYESGEEKAKIPYLQGRLHGVVQLFWSSGKKKRICTFSNGKRESLDQIWDEEGNLLDEAEYAAGAPIGCHRCWYENGVLKSMRRYHEYNRFDSFEWSRDGQMQVRGVFDIEKKYTETKWEEDGVKVRIGKWDGKQIQWEQYETCR